jgi:hypothetical protein
MILGFIKFTAENKRVATLPGMAAADYAYVPSGERRFLMISLHYTTSNPVRSMSAIGRISLFHFP